LLPVDLTSTTAQTNLSRTIAAWQYWTAGRYGSEPYLCCATCECELSGAGTGWGTRL